MKTGCPVIKYLLEQGKTFVSPVKMEQDESEHLVTGGITATSIYQPDGVIEAMVAKESIILLNDDAFTTSRFLSCDKNDVLKFVKHPSKDFYVLAVKTPATTPATTPVKQAKGKGKAKG